MKTEILLSRKAQKSVAKMPEHIVEKLRNWVLQVEYLGLNKVKEIKGYHDEMLSGNRKGQRSIRLNNAYRAIYKILDNQEIELIEIIDVNKHKY